MGASCSLHGSCTGAQASILEICLRYTCACPCALLALNPWFDLLTWPCTASSLHTCLVALHTASPCSPVWHLLRYCGIVLSWVGSLPHLPCCCPQLLASFSCGAARACCILGAPIPEPWMWCYMEKFVSPWLSPGVWNQYMWCNWTKLSNRGDSAGGQLPAVQSLNIQDRTVPSNRRRAGRECLVLTAGFCFPHASPALKLKACLSKIKVNT